MLKIVFFIIFFHTFCFGFSRAEEVKVSAGLFIGVIKDDHNGAYQLILKEAAKRANINIIEKVLPLKRAVNEFLAKEHLAIYGMTNAIIDEVGAGKIITSYPLGAFKLYLFTRKGELSISNLSQLRGKKIGGVIGYEAYYQKLIKQKIPIDYVADEENQLMKLKLKRVDAVLGFFPDWSPIAKTLSYDPNFPVSIGYDYMTVWNTAKGREFVNKISPALMEMKKDGTLKKLLGNRYMDFNYQATEKYEWVPLK
jgi:hypothetical protein